MCRFCENRPAQFLRTKYTTNILVELRSQLKIKLTWDETPAAGKLTILMPLVKVLVLASTRALTPFTIEVCLILFLKHFTL